MFKDLEHKKTEHPYVEPEVKYASTIEIETQATNNEFSELKKEFDRVNNVVKEQKTQTDAINLVDDILDEGNPFKHIATEDIWIEDDLFDNGDKQAIKDTSKEIIDVVGPNIDISINEPIEPITIPDHPETISIPDDIETIFIKDDVDVPSDDGIAIDTPKKVKIITTNSNQLRPVSNRIKKKYLSQRSRGILKKANNRQLTG